MREREKNKERGNESKKDIERVIKNCLKSDHLFSQSKLISKQYLLTNISIVLWRYKMAKSNRPSNKQSEIEYVLDCLHLGIHSGDGSGINRLHWIGFVDFIIKNPENPKKQLVHKLISVLCVKERTVLEYINCAVAWDILRFKDGMLYYNCTYHMKGQRKLVAPDEKTDDEILKEKKK